MVYEFTEEQNQKIDKIATKLRHISIMFYAFGAIQLLHAAFIASGAVIWGAAASGALSIGLGFVYQRPIDNLINITTTEGSDIPELMIGLEDLHVAYLTGQIIILGLAVVLLADTIRLLI